jgi:hypothetical protein
MEKTNNYPRMTELARTFPTLGRFGDPPGVEPFDAEVLHHWITTSGARTSGNHHAVAFVLNVFNSPEWFKVMPFDVVHAFSCWDDEHRAAFLAWARAPWFA